MLVLLATVLQLAAAALAARSLTLASGIERLLAGLIILAAAVSLAVLGTGLAGVLHPAGLLAVSAGWLMVAVLVDRRRAPARAARPPGAPPWDVLRWPPVAILAVLTVVSLGWRSAMAVRLPILDYDGLSYHLVNVVTWVQREALTRVPFRPWTDGYPAGGELITTWLAEITRSSALTDLTGLVAVPLLIVASAALARSFGSPRRVAALVGLLVGLTPAIVVLGSTSYVDVIAVACGTAASAVGLRALDARPGTRRLHLLVLAGIATGLAVGAKATFVVPLAVLWLALLVVAARWGLGVRGVLVTFLAGAVPSALVGGYWFARNVATFGNPLWPFHLGPLRGLGTFDELIVQVPDALVPLGPVARLLASWTADPFLARYTYDIRIGGFGVIWVPMVVLAILGAAMLVRRGRVAPVLVIALPAVVIVLTTPMNWWARLTLVIVPPVLSLAAIALGRLPAKAATAAWLIVVLGAGWSLSVATVRGNFSDAAVSNPVRTVRTMLADEERRLSLGLWEECRGFEAIPPGSPVTVAGFNLVGLVPGPAWDRVLLDPPGGEPTAATAGDAVRRTGAAYLVARNGWTDAALADPDTFEDLGEVCRGARLFRVLGPGG